MKKLVVLGCSLLAMAACKNTSEEVKVDETKVENPADSIVEKDTVAVQETIKSTDGVEVADEEKAPEVFKAEYKKAEKAASGAADVKGNYASFGSSITPAKALTAAEMLNKYKSLKKGDTIAVKFASKVTDVCKKKGCWMSMALSNDKESFVRFKDYGFFVPLNADNSEAVVSGKAYIDVVSVGELQHYAKDGGKSQEEINKITEPKITYAFQADGVLLKE
ncbi:MAG TPA: DUF4920 domain-containing protein [Flavobacterium sp.]|nr:DUF4920 domain-containing protein [Flavobacterium sp.]